MTRPDDQAMREADTTIDVVIPCYNAARYLAEAIRSVLSQGVAGTRILLVDDGSTDGSAEIAASFGERVTIIRQPNGGIASARNAGIAQASAPWLAFLDADDVWTEGSLAARLEVFERSPMTDLVFARLEQFHSPELDDPMRRRLTIDTAAADARFAGTLLAKRSSFLRAGPFDTSLKVGEMIAWIARAEAVPLRIAQLDRVVMRRRIHGNNTVLRQSLPKAHYLRALKTALDSRRARAGGS